MYTKEEYVRFYQSHGRCVDDISKRNGKLNEKQLESKYEKYVTKIEKKQNKFIVKDEKWIEIKNNLPKECELIKALQKANKLDYIRSLRHNGSFLLNTLDGAHYKSRQEAPFMKYDPDNVVSLNRYSHSMLDFMKNPIDGTPITKEEQENWWKFILGQERYDRLNRKFNEGR